MSIHDDRFFELIRQRRPGLVTDVRHLLPARYGKNVRIARPRGSTGSIISFHHTVSLPLTGVDGALAASWDFHIRKLGWKTGGYALIVTQDGHIYVAASPFSDMTWNAGERWNPITIAVVAVGCFAPGQNVPEDRPTPALLQSLYSVGLSLDDASGAKGGRPWRPHGALKQTLCPGSLTDHVWQMTGARYGAADPRPEQYP